jgi:DNA replication protein DnaC
MPYTREHWQKLVKEAQAKQLDYATFLENLLECEWQIRLERLQARRIKEAKFPLKRYLADFKRNKYDIVFYPKFDELETLKGSSHGIFHRGAEEIYDASCVSIACIGP